MFLLVSSLIAATLIALLIYWFLNTASRLEEVPGPRVPSFLVGNVHELESGPMGTKMVDWTKRYGQTYKMRGPLYEPWLTTGDPLAANHIFQGKNYIRPQGALRMLELFFGRGVFCTEGEEHRRMRKSLNAAFTFQSIREVSHVIFDLAYNLKRQYENMLEKREDKIIDIAPNIHMLALDAISMTMFMHNVSASEGRIPAVLHDITNSPSGDYFTILAETLASLFPSLLWLPNPIKRYGDNLRKEFRAIAEEVWAGKEGADMHAKVLDALARENNADGTPISKEEAIAQIISIMFAGSETTANVIAECIYELAKSPSIQKRVRAELVDFQSAKGHFPSYDDLMSGTSLPYFEAVIRETLRTKAVLREVERMAVKDDVIPLYFPIPTTGRKEVHVKAGQFIQVTIRDGINTDEAIWGADSSKFLPERWLEEDRLPQAARLIRAQGHLYTFGDGPKVCLGRTFAIAELKIVVAVLVSHFSFEDTGLELDFYHLGGNTIKPMIRGRENEGVQLPVKVIPL